MSTKKLTRLAMLTALTTALSLLFVPASSSDKRCRDPLRSRQSIPRLFIRAVLQVRSSAA